MANRPYTVHTIEQFDDLNKCYRKALDVLRLLQHEHQGARIIADYTGGTKSMSAGLVAAAIDVPHVELCLVKGERIDLVKVLDGTESVRKASLDTPMLERLKLAAGKFFQSYAYASGAAILEEAIALEHSHEGDEQLQHCLTAARAFDAWDKFDHRKAIDLLQPLRKEYYRYIEVAEKIAQSYEGLSSPEGSSRASGYEAVQDLINNAERRWSQGRYDDAVARLYRALEVMAQLTLYIQHGIRTGNVDLERVPSDHRHKYEKMRQQENGRIQLGLMDAYGLLVDLKSAIATAFLTQQNKLRHHCTHAITPSWPMALCRSRKRNTQR